MPLPHPHMGQNHTPHTVGQSIKPHTNWYAVFCLFFNTMCILLAHLSSGPLGKLPVLPKASQPLTTGILPPSVLAKHLSMVLFVVSVATIRGRNHCFTWGLENLEEVIDTLFLLFLPVSAFSPVIICLWNNVQDNVPIWPDAQEDSSTLHDKWFAVREVLLSSDILSFYYKGLISIFYEKCVWCSQRCPLLKW